MVGTGTAAFGSGAASCRVAKSQDRRNTGLSGLGQSSPTVAAEPGQETTVADIAACGTVSDSSPCPRRKIRRFNMRCDYGVIAIIELRWNRTPGAPPPDPREFEKGKFAFVSAVARVPASSPPSCVAHQTHTTIYII